TENSQHVDEFRPVALTAMMRRWFEMGVLDYINFDRSTSNVRQLNPAQAGFRTGHSTLAPAVTAHERALRDSGLYSIFLDFEGAYDLTVILRLLDKLKRKGATDGLLSIIASLFLFGSSIVVVNGKLTKPIPRQRGLAQGSLLSPTLYNIFLDDLLEMLDDIARTHDLPPPLDATAHHQVNDLSGPHQYEREAPLTPPMRRHHLCDPAIPSMDFSPPERPPLLEPQFSDHHAYADDVILQHRQPLRLQRMLDACSLWSLHNGARFKARKCGVVRPASSSHTFSIGIPRLRDDGQYEIDIQTIPVVETYRYLGFPFYQRGIAWQEHTNNAVTRAEALFHWSQRLGGDWSEYSRLTVFKIFIRPILEYGGALLSYVSRFGRLDMRRMEELDHQIQRWIFSVAHASISLLFHIGSNQQSSLFFIILRGLRTSGIPQLRDDGQYKIDIQTIPVVEMYRYLGFPFYQRGIAWQEHTNNAVTRVEALFHWSQRLGGDWSEYSRLTVFKIFIRPILEYGGALLSYVSRFGRLDMRRMEELDHQIQRWIFSVAHASISLRAVADIPSPADRFFSLSATFQLHVNEYPRSSPIQRMVTHLRAAFLEDRTGTVLRHISRVIPTGVAPFQLPFLPRQEEETPGELLNRRLREYHLLRYTTTPRGVTMPRCILPMARNAGPRNIGADHVMRWPSPATRRTAILWRVNLFIGFQVICPHCNERFHRGHLNDCCLYYGPLLQAGAPLVAAHHDTYENLPNSYNEIDALLNARAFTELERIFTHMDIHLCRLSRVPHAARPAYINRFGQVAPPLMGPGLRPDGADAL
ncbi:hypothetical protein PROFUN_12272, partial [Planoprotostelium fungivorum]